MTQEFDPKTQQKAGLGATLLAAALPYLGAFSFGQEAQAASSIDRGPISTLSNQEPNLSNSSLPKLKAETLPDGREINSTIDPKSLPKLENDSAGSWVKFLQTELNKDGFALKADGKFGPKTDSAVREFQTTHDLKLYLN
jgi:PPE-repeat protein